MRAFAIGDINNQESVIGLRRLNNSIKSTGSDIQLTFIQQTEPEEIEEHLKHIKNVFKTDDYTFKNLQYTYPKIPGEQKDDLRTGLTLTGYNAKDYRKVFACLVSHMRVWKLAFDLQVPCMVLEHDACFYRRFSFQDIKDKFTGGVLGLNSPLKATRRQHDFHHQVINYAQASNVSADETAIVPVPTIDSPNIPQGIAGNSAYIIKPFAAVALFKQLRDTGGWPNDALMCKQLFPWLQVCYPYYTEVQGIKSTTTL